MKGGTWHIMRKESKKKISIIDTSDSPKTNPPLEGQSPLATAEKQSDVPVRVFEKFIIDLTAAGLPVKLIERLRKTLLEEKAFTEAALTAAVLEEELPS